MWKKSFARRCSAILLAAVMVLGLVPVIYAADDPSITISADSSTKLTVGGTLELTADVTNEVTGGTISWSSNAPDVASVNPDNGDKNKATVTAQKSGTATITATYTYEVPDPSGGGGSSSSSSTPTTRATTQAPPATIEITVEAPPPEPSLSVTPTTASLTIGQKRQLTATKANGSGNVTWSVSGSSNVVTLTSTTGDSIEVTGNAAGNVTITAEYSGKTATCTVNVTAPQATVDRISVTLADIGDLAANSKRKPQLESATAHMSDGRQRDISRDSDLRLSWSIAPTTVATIDTSSGEITGVTQGDATVTVTATYGDKTTTATKAFKVVPNLGTFNINPNSIIMNLGDQSKTITATYSVQGGSADLVWGTDSPDIVTVQALDSAGVIGTLTAHKPGVAKVYAEVNGIRRICDVTVSGMYLDKRYLTIKEQESVVMPKYYQFGAAKGAVTWQSSDPTVAQISGTSVKGLKPGTATITARSGSYEATFDVTVNSNEAVTINRTIKSSDILRFSDLISGFNTQASQNTDKSQVDYLTSLRVDTGEGTLYYKYASEAEPGEGVAQNGNYYRAPATGQKGLSDIVFVPNPYYTGGTATITYTGVAGTQRFTGKIIVTLQKVNNNISLRTNVNTPLKLNGAQFNEICQRSTGAPLSYVTFSIPAENRGILYTNYYSADNYGGKVTPSGQYSQTALSEITFVPAPGWTGTLTLYYTGRSVGSSNNRYSGQVTIAVEPESLGGNVSYSIPQNGRVTFDDADFNDYCKETLSSSSTLRWVRFEALPDAGQGTLYYNWSSTSRPGSRVNTGESYYYGTTSPRLDRVTFEAASNYTGQVSIPFTGQDTNGNRFSGTVEINIRASGGEGTVRYSCAPGRTVRMDNDDFNDLSNDLTGRRLNYIVFDALPSRDDGTLYHNRTSSSSGTRVTTGTRYYNSSSPYIDNLYFQADRGFSGDVEIPFTGYNLGGDSFTGTVLVSSSGSSSRDISYTTDYQSPVVFDDDDFDDLCQWETDKRLNYVTFELPSSSQGTLYLNYRESSSSNTRVKEGTRYYRSSSPRLDQVTFLPASGYTGTAYINFKGYASDGTRFEGTVSVSVTTPRAEATIHYNTRTRPVPFRSSDFINSGRYTPVTVQFNAMPPSSAGYLYYQYSSPTQYTRQVNTGTTYQVNDSAGGNLLSQITFVPRAGYEGTFTIPFTGTNSSSRSYAGEVVITVDPSYTSYNFNDLGAYSNQARAAADFLFENNIASGVSSGQYGPEESIRRGDFALMVYRAFNLSSYSAGRSYFNDVALSDYYGQAVNTLYSLGIVSGTGNGSFSPRGTLSRQDAMLMVQKAMRAVGWNANDGGYGVLNNYGDAGQVSGYAQGAMAYMIQMGLLPTGGGQLAPRAPLTRIDMAQVVHRALTY